MPHGSLTLADYPDAMVRLPGEKCGRSGQYRKALNARVLMRINAD